MKVCSRCGVSKSLENFRFRRVGRQAGQPCSECKPCSIARSVQWGKDHPARNRARANAHRAANLERYRTLERARRARRRSGLAA